MSEWLAISPSPGAEFVRAAKRLVVADEARRRERLHQLRKALNDMIKDPTTKERMAKVQYDPYYAPADEFKAFVIKDIAQWSDVAKSANIKID